MVTALAVAQQRLTQQPECAEPKMVPVSALQEAAPPLCLQPVASAGGSAPVERMALRGWWAGAGRVREVGGREGEGEEENGPQCAQQILWSALLGTLVLRSCPSAAAAA